MPGTPDTPLGVLLVNGGGEILGKLGDAPLEHSSQTKEFPRMPLRGQVLQLIAARCSPRFTLVSHPAGLVQHLASYPADHSLVLHRHEVMVETGLALFEQFERDDSRTILIVGSPCLLGGPADPNGQLAINYVSRAIEAVFNLPPGVHVFDGGAEPIPVEQAELVDGWIVRKDA